MVGIVVGIIGVLSTVSGTARWYEADSLPELVGWTHHGSYTAERDLDQGWFIQVIAGWYDPPIMNGGDSDFYHADLFEYTGSQFFVEWNMESDAPAAEVDHHNGAALMVLVGGPVTYHFNMANGLAQFYTGYYPQIKKPPAGTHEGTTEGLHYARGTKKGSYTAPYNYPLSRSFRHKTP